MANFSWLNNSLTTWGRKLLLGATLLGCCWTPNLLHGAQAHPHAWYDITMQVVNTYPADLKISAKDYGTKVNFPRIPLVKGKTPIYGFIFTMRLDAVSAAPLIVDINRGQKATIWRELATNLVTANFFTQGTYQGKKITFAKAVSMIDVKIEPATKTLLLKYFAPLAQPIVMGTNRKDVIVLKTYDHPYWLDLSYRNKKKDITFTAKNDPNLCDYDIEDPSPSKTLVDYATALGADENPNDPDIGRHFTQTVYLACPLRTTR